MAVKLSTFLWPWERGGGCSALMEFLFSCFSCLAVLSFSFVSLEKLLYNAVVDFTLWLSVCFISVIDMRGGSAGCTVVRTCGIDKWPLLYQNHDEWTNRNGLNDWFKLGFKWIYITAKNLLLLLSWNLLQREKSLWHFDEENRKRTPVILDKWTFLTLKASEP